MQYQRPVNAKDVRENGRIILAHGEVTGHAHEVVDAEALGIPAAQFFEELDGRRVLLVERRCELAHPDHSCDARTFLSPNGQAEKQWIATGLTETRPYPAQVRQGDVWLNPLGPGVWEVVRQREWDGPDAWRRVAD